MREKPDNNAAMRCLGCGVKIEDFGEAECYDSDKTQELEAPAGLHQGRDGQISVFI